MYSMVSAGCACWQSLVVCAAAQRPKRFFEVMIFAAPHGAIASWVAGRIGNFINCRSCRGKGHGCGLGKW